MTNCHKFEFCRNFADFRDPNTLKAQYLENGWRQTLGLWLGYERQSVGSGMAN